VGLSIGDKIIANENCPGNNSSVKKGMTGAITKVEGGSIWLTISWDEGKYQDRVRSDSTKITKI
jgi:hypothetical protein